MQTVLQPYNSGVCFSKPFKIYAYRFQDIGTRFYNGNATFVYIIYDIMKYTVPSFICRAVIA